MGSSDRHRFRSHYNRQRPEAVHKAALEQPDLILLDIVLADSVDGYEVARQVRKFSDVPIIMLTARVEEADLLAGFNAGADDYITKPFSSKELLARVRAVLKRSGRHEPSASEINCGDLHIDLARRRVFMKEETIRLTRTEFNLLAELANHLNQVLLHDQLLSAVWGPEYRTIWTICGPTFATCEKSWRAIPRTPSYIVTFQGVGYMLECPEK